MANIEKVFAREVLDSRGNPTVEAEVFVNNQKFRAIVPSGASTGTHEALELRDKEDRFLGKGVLKAVSNVNNIIAPKLTGMDVTQQTELDNTMLELDGTENKTNLGANAILSVSMACAKAGAQLSQTPLYTYLAKLSNKSGNTLPVPQMNVINGGAHAGQENDIQEHMVMPTGAESFSEGLRMGAETYHHLKKLIKAKFGGTSTQIGDEGGFVPPLKSVQERLDLITKAIDNAGHSGKLVFALDSASSEFFKDGTYTVGENKYSPEELVDYYADLANTYPIVSIEDGHAEDDWQGWNAMTSSLGNKIQIVGDDLLVTNTKRIQKAIDEKSCNALLLKVNQIGSVTEAINAATLATKNNWNVVVSHRSGETEDNFIADLVVGLSSGQSKFGAPARSERNAKYNQLLRIEEELGNNAKYLGKNFRG